MALRSTMTSNHPQNLVIEHVYYCKYGITSLHYAPCYGMANCSNCVELLIVPTLCDRTTAMLRECYIGAYCTTVHHGLVVHVYRPSDHCSRVLVPGLT